MIVTLEQALTKGKGTERSFNCPVHNDRNASASVNVVKGVWVCYTCHASGTVNDAFEVDPQSVIDLIDELTAKRAIYSETWLKQYTLGDVHPYWLSRFSAPTCREFELGYDQIARKPCYPMRSASGAVHGVVHRNIDGRKPKYHYPKGVKKSELLFGYHRWHGQSARTVLLVEGAMDVIAAWETDPLVPAFGTYGTVLSDAQQDLLKKLEVERIVCAYDMDPAGMNGGVRIRNDIDWAEVERMLWPKPWGKDLAELDAAKVHNLMVNFRVFNPI